MPLFDLDISQEAIDLDTSQEAIDLDLTGPWEEHPVIKTATRVLQNTELENLKIHLDGEYFLTVEAPVRPGSANDPPELQEAQENPGVARST